MGHGDIFSEHDESSMETHAEDDSSITTEEPDESSSENSSEEEIDSWATLINDATANVRAQYDNILQALLMLGYGESEAKQEAFEKILPALHKELGDVYVDNLRWMKALKKDPIHKKIMGTRDDYVNSGSLRQVKVFTRTAFRRSSTFFR